MEILQYHTGRRKGELSASSDHRGGHEEGCHAAGALTSLRQKGERRVRNGRLIHSLRGHPLWEERVPVCGMLLLFFLSLGMVVPGAKQSLAAECTMVPPLFVDGNTRALSLAPPLVQEGAAEEETRSGPERTKDEGGDAKAVKELSLGEMEIAAYFEKDGSTYSGAKPRENHTVAADLTLFSIGESVQIGEKEYRVEDKVMPGSSDKLRIWFDSCEKAMSFGRQRMKVSRIVREESPPEGWELLGEFQTTGYCNCALCCGVHAGGPTASGTMPEEGRTVAVDPEVIPLGTELMIDGKKYVAEDTGRLVKGAVIDIYFDTHEEALRQGRQNRKIYIRKAEEGGGR